MSHGKETPSLKLPLFQDDDHPTFRGDMNEAFTKLDEGFGSVKTLGGNVSALETSMNALRNETRDSINVLSNQAGAATQTAEAAKNAAAKAVQWGDIDAFDKIDMQKVATGVIPAGEHAQGMAGDNSYLYIASMRSNSSNATITKVNRGDMRVMSRTTTPIKGHLNTLNYYNGKLYGTGGTGQNYAKLAVIEALNPANASVIDLPTDAWNFALVDSNGCKYAALTEAETCCFQTYVGQSGSSKLQFNRSSKLPLGAGINNGFFVDQMYVYQTFADGSGWINARNVLTVNTWGGENYRTFLLAGMDGAELEDIFVSDQNAEFYVNDHDGNVYKGTLYNRLKTNYRTGMRVPSQYSPVQCVYNANNGSESKNGNLVTSFNLQPNTYLGYLCDMKGTLSLGSYRFPVLYEPETGALMAYGQFLDGYDPVTFCLWWNMTGKSDAYNYTLDGDSWCAYKGSTTKGPAIGSLQQVTKKGQFYIDHITGFFGANPEYKIQL